MILTDRQITNFLKKITVLDNGCWEWQSVIHPTGYGIVKINGKPMKAHRVSWVIHNGEIPKGEGYHGTCVCHTCDNRKCVNPEHLFLGSNKDNIQDMKNKKRYNPFVGVGEENPKSKLTEEDVNSIRMLRKLGFKLSTIAKMYDVTISNISCICLYKSWKDMGAVV